MMSGVICCVILVREELICGVLPLFMLFEDLSQVAATYYPKLKLGSEINRTCPLIPSIYRHRGMLIFFSRRFSWLLQVEIPFLNHHERSIKLLSLGHFDMSENYISFATARAVHRKYGDQEDDVEMMSPFIVQRTYKIE